MRIIIRAAMDMPLLPAECAKYSELSGVQLEVLLQQIEQDVRCRLKEVTAHPAHPGTEIAVSAALVDAYALRATTRQGLENARDHAVAMMLHTGELVLPAACPTCGGLADRDLEKHGTVTCDTCKGQAPGLRFTKNGPPPREGHFLSNGQYLLPDGKITGEPMPGFMDYRPLDSVERMEPIPVDRGQVLDCGCTAGNHRPTCRWFSTWDRSPEYPPGYCIHGVHPGLRCDRCAEWRGGGQG